MSDDGSGLYLLLLGPAGAVGVYWALYRYYRNTDKSHAFESETKVDAKPVTGEDRKIGTNKCVCCEFFDRQRVERQDVGHAALIWYGGCRSSNSCQPGSVRS